MYHFRVLFLFVRWAALGYSLSSVDAASNLLPADFVSFFCSVVRSHGRRAVTEPRHDFLLAAPSLCQRHASGVPQSMERQML